MTNAKKQLKLTKLFRKPASNRVPEDIEELQQEVQELEQKLKAKQNELFQLQRNRYRRKAFLPPKNKTQPFTRPQKIILSTDVEKLKSDIELMSMLSGMEVQSYIMQDHCSIVYHMQHCAENQLNHGLKINMKAARGGDVEKYSLPLGFNLAAVMDDFDTIKTPECLGSVRKALVAYYDRLEQFEALKKFVNIEVQMFKAMDGSHMEVEFTAVNETDEDDVIKVKLALDYRVYDIRPKNYSVQETDLEEGSADMLKAQCISFKCKPLRKAFKEAFIDGCGHYKLKRQLSIPQPLPRRRPAPSKLQHNNDQTYQPDYSESDEDFPDN